MAKPLITAVTTDQTFQNWLNKTNELVGIMQNNVMTASGPGDTTNGDATLIGDFTSTNLVATNSVSTDVIASRTGGGVVTFQSPIGITSSSQIVATYTFASGPQTRYSTGSVAWDVGIESASPGNFIIDTGVAPAKFSLSPAGTLSVPNIIVTEDISVTQNINVTGDISGGTITGASFVGDGSGLTNVSTVANINDLTDVTISSPSAGQVLKYDGSKWVNGTDDTAGGAGLNADTLDSLNSTQFLRSDTDDTFTGTLTVSGNINQTGNLTVTGQVRATGNVITNYSASDRALKENVQIINNALDKVTQVNGYTFNYIDSPEESVTGVIAQEIEKVLPQVVFDHERNNGTYKAVRYDGIIPLLLEAIKELKDKVDDLENRLQSDGN